jgi:hypothetical protein
VQIIHTCQSCNSVMAVHEHSSYQEIEDCLRGMKPLCAECNSWPGSPRPSARAEAGQEVERNGN